VNNRTLERILTEPCFISGGALLALLVSSVRNLENKSAEHPGLAKAREALKPTAKVGSDGVAVIDITGTLAAKPDVFEMAWYGYEDSLAVADVIATTAKDPNVRAIVLNWDSPGGYLTGGPEVGMVVADVKKQKPVVSWSGGQMASLAYWIASQSSLVFASPSAQVGSIGVYSAIPDYTGAFEQMGIKVEVFKNSEAIYKAAGVPGTSLTKDHKEMFAASAQAWFDTFKGDVLAARPGVKKEAMQGQVLTGKAAQDAGLIDGVAGIEWARFAARKLAEGNRQA